MKYCKFRSFFITGICIIVFSQSMSSYNKLLTCMLLDRGRMLEELLKTCHYIVNTGVFLYNYTHLCTDLRRVTTLSISSSLFMLHNGCSFTDIQHTAMVIHVKLL
ncbi:hypothetical protein NL108_001686 [Boleophthalmus pectinirostris]|nr:hypothetical protein NL108_001686 [Boleophthalmus pectinirostris]